MLKYLDFKDARCKDCYRCVRECPVKAIEVSSHQAKIIADRCILCGHCTKVCPQNAKVVHTEKDIVLDLLKGGKVIASVAPSFASSFPVSSFAPIQNALKKLGFFAVEETAVGAKIVTEKYIQQLNSGAFKNYITSACPAVNRMIRLYHHDALKYLAPVDTPMIVHAKLLKKQYPDAKVVFIGPCIAKKQEAYYSGVVDAVLTFDDLSSLLSDKKIDLKDIDETGAEHANKARYYPISRGIIKSFAAYPSNYEYVAVDGVQRVSEVLDNIEDFSGLFLELNCCEYACVNGPCSIPATGGAVKANENVRAYALKGKGCPALSVDYDGLNVDAEHRPLVPKGRVPAEHEIVAVLNATGKYAPEDELNCGACGYSTCREKAWAVINGYAEKDMCVPYMRERAESMSYEIIQNSPNGILLVDDSFKISEINQKARELFGITDRDCCGRSAFDYVDMTEFMLAHNEKKNTYGKQIRIKKTGKCAELTVILLKNQNVMFGVMKDITHEQDAQEKLNELRMNTIKTTDEVIKKQMRVAQEIASLLGETTAESKVALINLKKTLTADGKEQ